MSKIIGAIGAIIAVVVLLTLLLQYLWAWLIPELFPMVVEKNYITSEIEFWEAFWIATLVSLLGFNKSS
jgi:hypothetical protein